MNDPSFFPSHFRKSYSRILKLKTLLKRELNIWHLFSLVAMLIAYFLLFRFAVPFEKTVLRCFSNGVFVASGIFFVISIGIKKIAEMLSPIVLLVVLGLLIRFDIFYVGLLQCVIVIPFLVFACLLLIPTITSAKNKQG